MIYNYAANILMAASGVGSSIDTSTPLSERLAIGGELLVVGLGTVFAVLMILWGVLALFKVVFYDAKNKNAPKPQPDNSAVQKKTAPPPKPVAKPVAKPEPAPAPIPAASDDGELIAAITAAVAAYLDAENAASGAPVCDTRFRVVSFRKARR